MKKVVFVTRKMIIGGIEKALISMIETMPKDEFDITILVMGNGGELLDEIPDHVSIRCLYGNEKSTLEKLWNYTKKGKVRDVFRVGRYTIKEKISKTIYEKEMCHSKMLSVLETEYDLAIAYHVPASFPVVYVINNIKATTKAAWIHSDVSQYERELKPYAKFYQKYDRILCVSKYALNKFVEMYPGLKEKTKVFYNILDKKKLLLLSCEEGVFNDNFEGVRLLTVGRLTSQKGQDIIPVVLARLISEGINLRWYCIGDGEIREELEDRINKYGLKEHLILLGAKKNPYPYFKACDIYVQPSRHEGYCITLAEARAFNKPIVTTDFVGALEQIEDGKDGLIIKFDEEELYCAVKELISNTELRCIFRDSLKYKNEDVTLENIKLSDVLNIKTKGN